MGLKARVIKIRCYFLNEWYETHKSLINYIDQTDHEYELTHPQYGIVKGQIESMVVRHDDRLQTAEIDLTFIENMRGIIDTVFAPPVDSWTESAFQWGQDELTNKMFRDVPDNWDFYYQVVYPEMTLFEQFTGLSRAAQAYVKQADAYVAGLKASLNKIDNPANSLVSSISYATNLPGVVIGTLAKTVERYALLYSSLISSPTRFLSSFNSGVGALENAFASFSKYTKIARAQRAAVELGSILKADQITSQAQKRAASVKTFSILGRAQKQIVAQEPVLSITEIEAALAIARGSLQEAIETDRTMQSLKDLAAVLTDHVIQIKKERPPIMLVSIDNNLPLHLICLKYGLPYSDAEQLLAINHIKHPSFVSGEVNVYVG
jgi:prophage DNA circulation protein